MLYNNKIKRIKNKTKQLENNNTFKYKFQNRISNRIYLDLILLNNIIIY